MEKITYYQPSLESLKRELDNYNKFINKDHVLFKFLVTYLAASVTENIEIPLPNMFRKFKRESLQRNGEKLIGQILDELHYLDNFDISSTFTLKNSGIKQLINLIDSELDRKIKNELALYRKENLLLNLTLDILYNYLLQPDDKRAVKLNNNYLSVCEKNLIIQDFSCNQSLPIDNTNPYF